MNQQTISNDEMYLNQPLSLSYAPAGAKSQSVYHSACLILWAIGLQNRLCQVARKAVSLLYQIK
jgi:hypothetical protein